MKFQGQAILSIGMWLMLAALPVSATPIRPDLRELLAQPRPQVDHLGPARAGWNGPEGETSESELRNPTLERYGPDAAREKMRAELRERLVPDWRVIGGLAALILLLRFREHRRSRRAAESGVAEEFRPAA